MQRVDVGGLPGCNGFAARAPAREKGEFSRRVLGPQEGVPRQVAVLDRLPVQPHNPCSRLGRQPRRSRGAAAREVSLWIERIAAFPVAARTGEGGCDGNSEPGPVRRHLFLVYGEVNGRRVTRSDVRIPERSEDRLRNPESEMPPQRIDPGLEQQPGFRGFRISGGFGWRRSFQLLAFPTAVAVPRYQEPQSPDSACGRKCPAHLRLDVAVGGPLIQPVDLDRVGSPLIIRVKRVCLLAVIKPLDGKSSAGAEKRQTDGSPGADVIPDSRLHLDGDCGEQKKGEVCR